MSHMKSKTKFTELKEIYDTLHGPKGCAWDKRQTSRSIIPHFVEEAEELVSAVKTGDHSHMKEELGDVLLNVMFFSKLAEKEGRFDIEDVIDGLIKKLKRRHPHVFANKKVRSVRDIIKNWNKIKLSEKRRRD